MLSKFFIRVITAITPFLYYSPIAIAAGQSNLINGRIVDLSEFPASVKALASGGGSCTATIVGERVLMLASHCVSHGDNVTFTSQGIAYSANCSQSPDWRSSGEKDHDIALCFTDKAVTDTIFENISIDSTLVKKDSEILLTGFGCIEVDGTDTPDGNYRIGETTVVSVPDNLSPYSYATSSGATLCLGDSGGPAFKILPDTSRIVVAVNGAGSVATDSYVTSTSSDSSKTFFNSWAAKYNARICGVHADAKKCMTSPITPENPNDKCGPTVLALSIATWSDCLSNGQPDLVSCDAANNKLQDCYATK